MSSAQRGISDHLLLESFERLLKWLLKIGLSQREAERGALQLTFVLSGEFTRDEAREAVDDVLGRLDA